MIKEIFSRWCSFKRETDLFVVCLENIKVPPVAGYPVTLYLPYKSVNPTPGYHMFPSENKSLIQNTKLFFFFFKTGQLPLTLWKKQYSPAATWNNELAQSSEYHLQTLEVVVTNGLTGLCYYRGTTAELLEVLVPYRMAPARPGILVLVCWNIAINSLLE